MIFSTVFCQMARSSEILTMAIHGQPWYFIVNHDHLHLEILMYIQRMKLATYSEGKFHD